MDYAVKSGLYRLGGYSSSQLDVFYQLAIGFLRVQVHLCIFNYFQDTAKHYWISTKKAIHKYA
jgi:hypothetical protein